VLRTAKIDAPASWRSIADRLLLDGHDLVHGALAELGDISREAPTMGQLVAALADLR